MDKVWKQLQLIINILAEINNAAFVTKFSETHKYSENGYIVLANLLLTNPNSLLKFSSKISMYFPQGKPRKNKSCTRL